MSAAIVDLTACRTVAMTPRRIAILTLAANGHTDRQIAARAGISLNTVHSHLRRVAAVLGARDRTHAVALAIKHGYIRLDAITN